MAGTTTGPGGVGTGALNTPFNPANLAQTPGYQFTLGQGEQAVNATAAARGGVNSGNTLQALMQYGQGLASTTYQQQLQDYLQQQQQQFGQEYSVAGLGENAAAGLGNTGVAATSNIGNSLTQAGSATAAGTLGAASAANAGTNSLATLLAQLANGGGGAYGTGSGTLPAGFDMYGTDS